MRRTCFSVITRLAALMRTGHELHFSDGLQVITFLFDETDFELINKILAGQISKNTYSTTRQKSVYDTLW